MEVSLFNVKITFQEAVVESDEIGNRTNTWKDYYTCHATVSGENGSEQNTAGQTVEDGKVDFTIRYCKKAAGILFAYDHFAEGEAVDPPFICYLLPGSDNFAADGKVYHKISRVNVELYTDKKDLNAEQKVEDALDAASIFYAKSEVWIDSEKLYEVLYEMEV